MDRQEALTRIVEVLSEELGIPEEDITPGANLREDLSMDSLDMVELVASLEEQIGTKVPETELEAVQTIDEVVDLVLAMYEDVVDSLGEAA